MTAFADLLAVFSAEGLPPPPIPEEFASALRPQGPWCWATRQIDPFAMYLFEAYPVELVASGSRNYVGISHAGHGANSYGVNYHLVRGPLALFCQAGWGGVYMDAAETTSEVRELLDRCAALIKVAREAEETRWNGRGRLVVRHSPFRGISTLGWLPEPIGTEDSAIRWLRGRPPTADVFLAATRYLLALKPDLQ